MRQCYRHLFTSGIWNYSTLVLLRLNREHLRQILPANLGILRLISLFTPVQIRMEVLPVW